MIDQSTGTGVYSKLVRLMTLLYKDHPTLQLLSLLLNFRATSQLILSGFSLCNYCFGSHLLLSSVLFSDTAGKCFQQRKLWYFSLQYKIRGLDRLLGRFSAFSPLAVPVIFLSDCHQSFGSNTASSQTTSHIQQYLICNTSAAYKH